MNPTIQSGMHPDAESLTAFAEQLLPAPERDQILAHMATCSRCREVVFLAQRALEEDQSEVVPTSKKAPTARRARWFDAWRWTWIPVAALATFMGLAVLQHFRHPAESTQMAVNKTPADALQKTVPSSIAPPAKTAATTNSATLNAEVVESAKPLTRRDEPVRQAGKEETKRLDEKKAVEQKGYAALAGAAPLPPGVSGGSMQEMLSARAKASPTGGPAAVNQFQQQSMAQQNLALQNSMMKAQNVPTDKVVAPRAAALGAASETVSVQADQVAVLPTPAPASSRVSSVPLTGEYHGTLSSAAAKQKAIQKIILPSGLGVLATASEASRIVALDTAGALFLSEDGGKNWQSIPSQWTGRALLVRTRPVGTEGGASRAPQILRFELVNDKLQTWLSYDGRIWTAQTLPLK
ncbi:zf-HC2 domain-containing protein [Telmatobacter sp. DSM 110680]|uniref:Zf-HC2 domain-containing protein n=1 Tax=Telmatobacter sp. DSM 110680 TaxID=3036704 RepID=A0AAU7DLA0_9BACT